MGRGDDSKGSDVRKRAESKVRKSADVVEEADLSPEKMRLVVHELRVHQIELEMQNEELRLAQLALEQAKDKYLDLYDYAPVAYFTLDENGLIMEANLTAVQLLGIDIESLLKKPFSRFICKDDQDTYYFHSRLVLDQKTKQTCEIKLVKKGGKEFHAQLESVARQDEKGDSSQLRIAVTDITLRKRAETEIKELNETLEMKVAERTAELEIEKRKCELRTEDLDRSNKDLQQFAYVASHDLQEPLRNVATCLQMLEKKYKNKLDADADRFIGYAVESASWMRDLIMDLLEFSRIGTKVKPPKPTDCEEVLDRTLKGLRSTISEAEAEITHDPLPTVAVDETQLLQVFQNLIGNAIKFRRDEPPKVHVSAVKNKKEWQFSVRDNGIGIESEHLDRIFVIFQRIHKRSQYDGTGMGLAIVKKVVERHGGRVWAESQPGKGTTFYFTMPAKEIRT
jgi:two-component system, chemotaxis family, sensor kinase Cph1